MIVELSLDTFLLLCTSLFLAGMIAMLVIIARGVR